MRITKTQLSAVLAFLTLALVESAQASLIRERFIAEVLPGGPAAGETGFIEVEYDETFVPDFGEFIFLGDEFSLTLDLFGQTFNNANDRGFDFLFPELVFEDRNIVFIDFVVNEFDFFNPTPITDPRIEEFGGGDVINGTWFVTTFGPDEPEVEVPVPATFALMLAGLWGAGRGRRKVASRG
jgi:hypothetical protein